MRRSCATRSRSCRTTSSACCSSAGPRSCAARRTTACRSSTRSTRSRRISSSTSPTSRCSGRASACSGPRARSRSGCPYVGADFRFDPPTFHPVEAPSLAVIGLGKRVGKTAVTGHVAARARPRPSRRRRRDGPRRAGGAGAGRDAADARRPRSRSRAPAGTRRPTISRRRRSPACRRSAAGAPAAGSPARRSSSNVLEGARLAAKLDPDCVVFDGSGAAIPPVDVGRADPRRERRHDARAGLNAYRVLVSDLVVDTGGADREAIRSISDVPVVAAELRLRPVEPLHGRRTAVFTTGPAPTEELDADVVHVSRNLARRDALRDELERVDAEVYPRRAEGGRDRRRGRGRARARRRGRARRQRRRLGRARRARPRPRAGRRCAHDRAAPDHAAARSGRRARPAVLARADGALAHGGRRAPGTARTRSRAASATSSRERGERPDRARAARGARGRDARRGGGTRGDPAPAPLPGAPRARPADHGLRRRRDRHRQVDGRDGDRVPLRDHARHVDGLRPADDARVLLARRSCPSIHYSSFEAGDVVPGRRRPARGRLPRAVAERARRRARVVRARARGGLVARARGRPPRAGAGRAAAVGARRLGLRRALDRRRGGARAPLPSPRRGLGAAAGVALPRPLRRHPPAAGVHRRRARSARACR